MYALLSTMQHLGNLTFTEVEAKGAQAGAGDPPDLVPTFINDVASSTEEMASALGLIDTLFIKAVTSRTITSGRGSMVVRKLNAREVRVKGQGQGLGRGVRVRGGLE